MTTTAALRRIRHWGFFALVRRGQAQAVDQPVTAHRIQGEVDPGRTDDLAHRLPPIGTAHRMVRTAARGEGTLCAHRK